MASPGLTRRDFLRTGLLFSASLMAPRLAWSGTAETGSLNLLGFGDWGTGANARQTAVAGALQSYARTGGFTPDALLLLGDNFYGPLPGVDSPRWTAEFESMYPAADFPGPCYAMLGNHDYDDQPGGHHNEDPRLTPWKTLFHDHGVDAYVCGHEHDLQHMRVDGITTDWLISGGGGQNLHPVKTTEKTKFGQPAFGFVHLAISPKTLRATFVGTDAQPLYGFEREAGRKV